MKCFTECEYRSNNWFSMLGVLVMLILVLAPAAEAAGQMGVQQTQVQQSTPLTAAQEDITNMAQKIITNYVLAGQPLTFEDIKMIDEDLELSISLLLDPTPGKLYLYLNGVLIDRSGNKFLSQQKYWLPEGLLNLQGHNELLVMQWTRGGEPLLGSAQLVSTSTSVWYSESFASS